MRVSLFSLLPGHRVEPEQDLHEVGLRRAVLAEELGFHCFWIAEHHIRTVSCVPNPAVFLAAASQRTERIRLGAAVAVLSVRHPLLTAEEYALVDRLSGGRLNFGVGSGTSPVELAGVGIDVETKRDRFAECLALLRRAWIGEGGAVSAAFHEVGDLRSNVMPVQQPAPPIWIAVGGVEAARETGVSGDGMLLLLSPDVAHVDIVRGFVAAYRAGLKAGGHDASVSQVSAAVFGSVAADSLVAREQAAASFGRLLAAQDIAAEGKVIVESMLERGTSFAGDPDFIADQMRVLEDAGVDEVLFCLDFGGAPESEIEASMRLVASTLISNR